MHAYFVKAVFLAGILSMPVAASFAAGASAGITIVAGTPRSFPASATACA